LTAKSLPDERKTSRLAKTFVESKDVLDRLAVEAIPAIR
jgi:hypothetical protein